MQLVKSAAPGAAEATERRGLQIYLLNTVLGAVLGIFSKLAARDGVPFFQLVLMRSLTLVGCTIPMLLANRINPFAHHDKQWLLVLRGLLGWLGITSWYWSLALLPMSDVNALGFLAPIFVALLAPHVLEEPTPRGIYYAMPFSIAGVLFVAQPSWLFGARSQTNTLGVAIATANALFSTGAKLSVRALAAGNQPMADIVFSFGFISLLGSTAMCASMPKAWVLPTELTTWAYIVAACALGYLVQVSFTSALQKAKAAPAAVCDYLSMVWTIAADGLIFRRMPSTLSLCGAAIIVAASLIPLFCGRAAVIAQQEGKQIQQGVQLAPKYKRAVGDDSPLKASSFAESEEVQLAKISKYLGKGGRGGSGKLTGGKGGCRSSSEGEAVGLVGQGSRKYLGSEEQDQEKLAWDIPAVAGRQQAEGGGKPPDGVLQQVLIGAPNRTSSEKEAMLQLAGK